MARMMNDDHEIHEKTDDVEVVSNGNDPSLQEQNLILARELYPAQLPVLPVNQRPFFPKMRVPMVVGDPAMKQMLVEVAQSDQKFLGFLLHRPNEEDYERDENQPIRSTDLYDVGVIGELRQVAQPAPEMPIHIMASMLERFCVTGYIQEEPYMIARVEYLYESDMSANEELKAYSMGVIKCIKELVQLDPLHKEEINLLLSQSSLDQPGRLADFAAAMTSASGAELQEILKTTGIPSRLRKVLELLHKEVNISKLQAKISKQIEEKLSKQQRQFFLREQLKQIKKELGLEKEGKETEVERFEERIAQLTLSDEARERIEEELGKLKLIEQASPEFNVTRTYLDWLTILPWGIFTEDGYDIKKAEKILNQDHYGLVDVKDRILEFLSVGMMKGNIAGTILCFIGPPGVGKTSIGKSIARSIGRNFYRFSVGGMRDEAEIKGHRRTYIGALPGKFIQAIKTCKSANPVIMIDEIDKIGASYHGDPASALLEVLDPEQNRDFLDHYLDVRFDLSNVFFICTANQIDTIPRPLLDRMEVINIAGYILQEKLEIARAFLMPRQLEAHGLNKTQLSVTNRALTEIIEGYAREPGVRNLEKHLKKIIRKSVKKMVQGEVDEVKIDKADVDALLGKRLFNDADLFCKSVPGVVLGLAWTSMGGDTLHIEATKIATGKSGFKQTGQLGDVMVESSEIAYTFIQAFMSKRKQARDFFQQHQIHLHVPAGATPKDGPSAGITMASALYSLALDKPIKKGFAMTGELSLTGLVMPIGGVKEKTIAAKRAKVKSLVFPAENRKDFDELPEHVRKGLTAYFVNRFEEVIKICFEK